MELIYLWVEDYKNIHNQGFNFSSKFNCHYDGETLIIDDNIDKDGNKQYIENFFGENINVTAIVGKNGSGKSNFIKFTRLFLTNEKSEEYRGFLIFYNNKIYLLNNSNLTFEKINNLTRFEHEDTDYSEKNWLETDNILNSAFPIFDYSSTYDLTINSLSNQIFPIYPEKDKGIINILNEENENTKNIVFNYHILKEYETYQKAFKDFFIPKYIKVSIDLNILNILNKDNIPQENIQNKINQKEYTILYDEIIQRINSYEPYMIDDNSSLSFLMEDVLLKEYLSKIDFLNDTSLYEKSMTTEDNLIWYKFDIDNLTIEEIKKLTHNIEPFFHLEISTKEDKEYNNLSFGEKQLISILNQIHYLGYKETIHEYLEESEVDDPAGTFTTLKKEKLNINNLIIFFDEIDIGFHPDWQKRTIQYIVDFLSLISEKKFHLIFTTHSPFLLSDIPKENIIFLNDKLSINQTFGANIHTLLSDSFFMEDGLMGEFAKNKIQEIMDFLNNIKTIEEISTKEEQIKQVIESIGEPFLKEKLLQMYYNKFDTKKQERIKELKAELKRLENG